MCAKRGVVSCKWVTTGDIRYNNLMAEPKEYLVRLIMGLGDMARYDDDKREKERKRRERIC